MNNIGKSIAKGAIWMVLFKLIERSIGLISTIILARLLFPADFGLIAMAMSIIAVLELLGAFGFDMALIQKSDTTRSHFDTAWSFNIILALVSAVILLLLAYPAAVFYEEPRLEIVIYFLAAGTFIAGFQNIGVVYFRKELEFNKEFQFLLGKKLASFCVTIPLAFILQSYWALVFGILAGKIGSVLLSYYVHNYRPRFDLSARSELFHFSKWLLLNNILYFIKLRSADFIIGKTSGSHSLGLYSIAFEISNLPTTELIAPINRAIYPGYTKMTADTNTLQQGFLNVIAIIILFALPAGTGIAVSADLLVKVVFGDKWLEAIPLIKILSFYGVFTALQTNTVYVYLAIGKPRLITYISILYIIILLPTLLWMIINMGAIGAAWAYFGTALLMLPVYFTVISRHLNISISLFFKKVWRPLVASAIMYTSVHLFLTTDILPEMLMLFSAIAIGAISYTLSIILLWNASSRPTGAEHVILEKVFPRLPASLQFRFLHPTHTNP